MVCEVHCIMGPEETKDHLVGDSVDLYSKVKLRRLSGKIHGSRHGNLGYNVKLMTVGSGKSMGSVGVKSRRICKNEGKTTVINSRKLEKNHENFRGLNMTSLVEFNISCIDREGNRGGGVLSEIDRMSDEDTAVEALGALKERRSETTGSEFKLGNLVWGKIKSHPWWPGQIFDEALVSFSSVKKTKGEGFLLVIFFGDNTYGWLEPKELIPFEPHYLELKNQSKSQLFLMAVQEALDELNKIAALGFTCRCRNPSNFCPANASGLLKVDIHGYEEGATYSVDQVKRSREEFKPVEMLSFLQQLASRTTDMSRDGDFLKNVARLLAYRKAVFEENDDTFAEAFGMLEKSLTDSMEDASHPGKAIFQGAASSNLSKSPDTRWLESKWKVSSSCQYLDSEIRGEGKILGKPAKLEKSIYEQKMSEISCTLDEDIAIEVLGTLKERRPVAIGCEFKVGDLVWGKVKCHPWWPGQVFDEALVSSSSVKKTKTEGFLLVAFFGDNTYRWLDRMELIPFEPYYLEKKNQLKSHTQTFQMAVQEAISELHRRVALGFACRCRNPSNLRPANASGLLKVDVDAFEEGATYFADQVERSREEFKSVKLLSFLQKLASRTTDMRRDGYFLKNVARILAYRKAVFEEKDDTYDEAFEELPSLTDPMEDTDDPGEPLVLGTAEAISNNPESPVLESFQKVILSGRSLTSEARDEGKILGKRVKLQKAIYAQKCSRTEKFCDASGDSVKSQFVEEETKEPGAILVMKFPPRATMPPNSMLKASFERFGPLVISATYASWNSSICQVGFLKMSDAQVAYDYVVRNENLFGSTKISYIYKAQKFLQPLRRFHNCVPQAVVRERVEVMGDENLFAPQKLILKKVMQ